MAAGTHSPGSDLDVTVLLDGPPAPYRESMKLGHIPVELFVQTEFSLMRFCEADLARRRPTTMRLVGSSIILVDRDGSGLRLQTALRRLDENGPSPMPDSDLETLIYTVTGLVDDLQSIRDDDERLMAATRLVRTSGNLILA